MTSFPHHIFLLGFKQAELILYTKTKPKRPNLSAPFVLRTFNASPDKFRKFMYPWGRASTAKMKVMCFFLREEKVKATKVIQLGKLCTYMLQFRQGEWKGWIHVHISRVALARREKSLAPSAFLCSQLRSETLLWWALWMVLCTLRDTYRLKSYGKPRAKIGV